MEPSPYDKSCFEVSKKMIRLLRHDPSVFREEDGAVEFRILAQIFRSGFTSSQQWSTRAWLRYLQKGGPEKRFQCCVDPHFADTILYLRGKHINPALQDNVLLPSASITLEAPMKRTRSFNLIDSGWQRRQ